MGIFDKFWKDDTDSGLSESSNGSNNWSVWFIACKDNIQLVSAENFIDSAIPEDGSFESAWLIRWGLTEEEADEILEVISYEIETKK